VAEGLYHCLTLTGWGRSGAGQGGGPAGGECWAERERGPEEERRVGEELGVSRSVRRVQVVGARSASMVTTCGEVASCL